MVLLVFYFYLHSQLYLNCITCRYIPFARLRLDVFVSVYVCMNLRVSKKCGTISDHVIDFGVPAFLDQVAIKVPLVLSSGNANIDNWTTGDSN